MYIKIPGVLFVIVASASFSATAANIIPNSGATAEALVTLKDTSTVGISIEPLKGLTVDKIKLGDTTNVAAYTLTGRNAAVHIVNPDPAYNYCTWATGQVNTTNRIHLCLRTASNGFDSPDKSKKYFRQAPGKYYIRGGNNNKSPAFGAVVGADTYTVSLEVVKYTL